MNKILHKNHTKQVQSDDERQVIKATAYAWFQTRRPIIVPVLGDDRLRDLDTEYQLLLSASGRAILRSKYTENLKRIKTLLVQILADHVITLSADSASPEPQTSDVSPDFATLVADTKMQAILANRWQECVKCVGAGAPLAATVMMGGVLEGLLLARINLLNDKSPVFKAATAPKDRTGTPLRLNEWGLKNYLDVAHELGWISRTTKDVGEVVRDYRNYIHPQKEFSHGISISVDDARTLWEVAKSVAHQVLRS